MVFSACRPSKARSPSAQVEGSRHFHIMISLLGMPDCIPASASSRRCKPLSISCALQPPLLSPSLVLQHQSRPDIASPEAYSSPVFVCHRAKISRQDRQIAISVLESKLDVLLWLLPPFLCILRDSSARGPAGGGGGASPKLLSFNLRPKSNRLSPEHP